MFRDQDAAGKQVVGGHYVQKGIQSLFQDVLRLALPITDHQKEQAWQCSYYLHSC
jgi:hypothetical protein